MSISKTILIGNLGQDPEVRFMPNGNAVCNFSLATTEKMERQNNWPASRENRVASCFNFRETSRDCRSVFEKGSKVYIEGRNQTREWEKDGVKRYTTEVIVDMRGTMQMLDGKQNDQQRAGSYTTATATATSSVQQQQSQQ